MDPINIIIGINVIALFGANISTAKRGLISAVGQYKEKPSTYLQALPTALATLSLIALIFALFQIGTLGYSNENISLRIIALIIDLTSSWLQIVVQKSLKGNYSQDVVIFKKHTLITTGLFKWIRHPQYFFQILIEFAVAIAVLSYVVFAFALVQIPFLILRARLEEKILEKHFKDEFVSYKKSTGFIIPFIK